MTALPTWESAGIVVVRQIGLCWHCARATRFVDLDFQAYLHPGDCQLAKVNEWLAADAAAGPYDWPNPLGITGSSSRQ